MTAAKGGGGVIRALKRKAKDIDKNRKINVPSNNCHALSSQLKKRLMASMQVPLRLIQRLAAPGIFVMESCGMGPSEAAHEAMAWRSEDLNCLWI
ncbi:hypothetical protein KC363_g129 [Hortaea werneckii]|nr:hypothetical protein KC363_g129 [Hortaea werneckii]